MMESWRELGTEEGLEGQLLPDQEEGTQGMVTGDRGGSGALWGHRNLGALCGFLVLHTCGTGFHETDVGG